MKPPIRALGAVAVSVLALLLPAPGRAVAAAGCHGDGCAGLTASAEGCDADGYVVASAVLGDPAAALPNELDLYYSPSCAAAWGEYLTTDATQSQHLYLTVQPEYGGVDATPVDLWVDGHEGDYRTTMIAWSQSIRFCGAVVDTTCTGWR